MNYCSQDDLIKRYGQDELIELTDEAAIGTIDASKVTQAISDACATIDGYLAGRYQLPLANVPTVLNRLAAEIARYFLWDDGASESVLKRYEDAITFLVSVSKGIVALSLSDTGQKAETSDCAEMVSDGHVFSRRDKGFV